MVRRTAIDTPIYNEFGERACWMLSKYRDGETLQQVAEYLKDGFLQFGPVPHTASLALYLGATSQTLRKWARQYPEFADAVQRVLDTQHSMLLAGGLTGAFNPQITKLVLGTFGYSDRIDATARLADANAPTMAPAVFVAARRDTPVTIVQAPASQPEPAPSSQPEPAPASQPEPAPASQPERSNAPRLNAEHILTPADDNTALKLRGRGISALSSAFKPTARQPASPSASQPASPSALAMPESALARRRRARLNGAN